MSKSNKITFVLASLICSFFLLDIIMGRTIPINCQVSKPDNTLHHILIPYSHCKSATKDFKTEYVINDIGLRNEHISIEKPLNTTRLLFLGDSFTYGTGVDLSESFPKVFEDLVKSEKKVKNIDVINAGVPGYGLVVEDLYLKQSGFSLNPDVVVVNISMTDFFDERRYLKIAKKDASGKILAVPGQKPTIYFTPSLHEFLKKNSFIYNVFLKKQEDIWKLKGKLQSLILRKSLPDYAKDGASYSIGDLDNDTFAITRQIDDESFRELFNPLAKRLIEIKSRLDNQNIKMIIVVIPNAHQVDKSQWPQGRKAMKLEDDAYPVKIFEELNKFAQENEIVTINVLDDLKTYLNLNSRAKLFYDYDGHLTVLGNKIVAKRLFEELKDDPKINIPY